MKHISPLASLNLSALDVRHLVSTFASRCWAAHVDSRAAQARQQEIWRGSNLDWQQALKRSTAVRVGDSAVLRHRATMPRVSRAR